MSKKDIQCGQDGLHEFEQVMESQPVNLFGLGRLIALSTIFQVLLFFFLGVWFVLGLACMTVLLLFVLTSVRSIDAPDSVQVLSGGISLTKEKADSKA